MKNFIVKTSLLLLLAAGAFAPAKASVSIIQGTIKPGTVANTVDIYFKPTYSNTTEYFTNIVISIAIPTASFSATPTLTVTSSQIPTFPVSSWTNGALGPDVIGSYTVFSYNVVRNGTTAFPFTANTEFKVATIAFTGNLGSSQIRLADYTSANGGNSGFDNFYVETNVSSQVSSGTSTNMFYSSPTYSSTGTQGTDGYAQTISAIALPVALTSFSGVANGCSATLNWQTATEQQSSYYAVEQSTDGNSFAQVGKVASKNSLTGSAYTYAANLTSGNGTNYFRLRIVDMDGSISYSSTVVVTGTGACSVATASVYPNPAAGSVYVQGLSSGDHVSLLNTIGQKLGEVTANNTSERFSLAGFASGMYLIQIQKADGTSSTVKLVVKQ